MTRRGRWARGTRALLAALVAIVAALTGAVVAALFAVNTPTGRRWAAEKVEVLVSEAIPGSVTLERIRRLTPGSVEVEGVVFFDEAGERVLEVDSAVAVPDLGALVRGVIGLRSVRVVGARARLDPGEREVFKLVEAFWERDESESDDESAPTVVVIDSFRLEQGRAQMPLGDDELVVDALAIDGRLHVAEEVELELSAGSASSALGSTALFAIDELGGTYRSGEDALSTLAARLTGPGDKVFVEASMREHAEDEPFTFVARLGLERLGPRALRAFDVDVDLPLVLRGQLDAAGPIDGSPIGLSLALSRSQYDGVKLPRARAHASLHPSAEALLLEAFDLPDAERRPDALTMTGRVGFDGGVRVALGLRGFEPGRDPALAALLGGARGRLDGQVRASLAADEASTLDVDASLRVSELRVPDTATADAVDLSAHLEGPLDAPRLELEAASDQLRAFDQDITRLRARVEGTPEALRVSLLADAAGAGLDFATELSLRDDSVDADTRGTLTLDGTDFTVCAEGVHYADDTVEVDSLRVTGAGARIRARGSFGLESEEIDLELDVDSLVLEPLAEAFELGDLRGTLRGSLAVGGSLSRPSFELEARVPSLEIEDQRGYDLSTSAQLTWSRERELEGDFTVSLSDGSHRDPPSLHATVEATGVGTPGTRARFVLEGSGVGVGEGPRGSLEGQLELREGHAEGHIKLRGGEGGGEAALRASAPISLGADGLSPTLPADGLELHARFSSFSLEPLASLLPLIPGSAGRLDGRVHLSGSVKAPVARGRLTLSDVSMILPGLDQRLTNVDARVAIAPGRVVLRYLRGRDLSGRLALSGEATLDGLLPTSAHLDIDARGFPIRQEGIVTALLTTKSRVELRQRGGETRGELNVASLDLRLPAELGRDVTDLAANPDIVYVDSNPVGWEPVEPVEPTEAGSALDELLPLTMRVEAPDPFWVRRDDLAVQLLVDLEVEVREDGARVRGEVRTLRGFVELMGARLELGEGSVRFTGGSELDPLLDVRATANAGTASEVQIALSGSLSAPVLRFSDRSGQELSAGAAMACITSTCSGSSNMSAVGEGSEGTDSADALAQQATGAIASVAAGLLTSAARQSLGARMPQLSVDTGDSFGDVTVRAGFQANELIPSFLRGVIRSLYVQGYVGRQSDEGQESSSGNTRTTGGFIIELRHPHRTVTRGRYEPPASWSIDVTWEP